MSASLERVRIDRLGRRGEGVAATDRGRLYVPYALPGELVTVARPAMERSDRAALVGVVEPSLDRITPVCPYFTTCGGCAVQGFAEPAYAAWKRGLVVDALARERLAIPVRDLVDAHGTGRRRATFHARTGDDGRIKVGFMEARSHAIVAIAACPILDPALADALPAANAVVQALANASKAGGPGLRKPLDLVVAATDQGLDVDLRGHGPLTDEERAALSVAALALRLARLSNHGTIVVERQRPTLAIGMAHVELPTGAFLQATVRGEIELAARVLSACAGRRRVADLFCGIGTFALRLAAGAEVSAFDQDAASVAALDKAWRAAPSLRRVRSETRDLFARPLTAAELAPFEAVVLDPPRAGAEAQMRAIAASGIERVVCVSCDASSFSRDAAILVAAGFKAEAVTPIDQFRYAAHVELVACFSRPPMKRARRLLG